MDDLQLALVHLAGDGDQDEPEGIESCQHFDSPLSRAVAATWVNRRGTKQIRLKPVSLATYLRTSPILARASRS